MKYLLIFLSEFEVSDGIITHFLVRKGLAQEGNPLLESVIMDGNFLLLKIIGVLPCVLILWALYKRFPRVILVVTATVVMFYGAIMVWNLSIFLSA